MDILEGHVHGCDAAADGLPRLRKISPEYETYFDFNELLFYEADNASSLIF
jgi:hypothetical protein